MRSYFIPSLLALSSVLGCSTNSTSTSGETFKGTPVAIGSGSASAWATTDASGAFKSIGVTITNAALASVGTDDLIFDIPIPQGVTTPFKSIELDYAAHDDAPFDKPHFDPHFFFIDMAARMAIDTSDVTLPAGITMPAGFEMMDHSEAMMGIHWIDTSFARPFRSTFAYGFWKGAMVFLEPMCDMAALKARTALTAAVKRPVVSGGAAMPPLPVNYAISYDSTIGATSIELTGF